MMKSFVTRFLKCVAEGVYLTVVVEATLFYVRGELGV